MYNLSNGAGSIGSFDKITEAVDEDGEYMSLYAKAKKIYEAIQKKGLKSTVSAFAERKKTQKRDLHIIQHYHLISEEEMRKQRDTVWSDTPLISIITPLYNTSGDFLEQLLQSVTRQTYSRWELCLADGSDSEHSYVEEICRKYAKSDSRFKYNKLENNKGIVGNTNSCIEMSEGEYIGLLDHDDLLHPSALYEVVSAIEDGADFIYTDEMKFRESVEQSTDIVCKNGFSKDELRSHNYICHFVTFKKTLMNSMEEAYSSKYEGSQDYDMVLKLTERAENIVHIPKILYYWRVHAGSVSMDLSTKQYAVESAKRAIAAQLLRSNEPGVVECNLPYQTIYRIEYRLKVTPTVSIYLWGNLEGEALISYIQHLVAVTNYKKLEIFVPIEMEDVTVGGVPVKPVSADMSGAYEWFNRAERLAVGSYNLFLSEQCIPMHSMWIEEMLMIAQREDVGVVGGHIKYLNNRTYFSGAVLDKDAESGIHVINFNMEEPEHGYEANLKHVRSTTILSSCCMLVSRNKLQNVGGFRVSMRSCADADLCMRFRKQGYQNVWTCFSQVFYKGAESIYSHWGDYQRFREVWNQEIECTDEYYHPLLKKLGKI